MVEGGHPIRRGDPKKGRKQISKVPETGGIERRGPIRPVRAKYEDRKELLGPRFGAGGSCWGEWIPFSKELAEGSDQSKSAVFSTSGSTAL
jgi:hypothetical protein